MPDTSNEIPAVKTVATILSDIKSYKGIIKSLSFCQLLSLAPLDEIDDDWSTYSQDIDINIHVRNDIVTIQAYPVVNGNTRSIEWVEIAELNVKKLSFDPLLYYGHHDIRQMTPLQIAETNVIEHYIAEIEHFKDLGTPKDLETASELYDMYLQAIRNLSR